MALMYKPGTANTPSKESGLGKSILPKTDRFSIGDAFALRDAVSGPHFPRLSPLGIDIETIRSRAAARALELQIPGGLKLGKN